jgi:hypothetical protein
MRPSGLAPTGVVARRSTSARCSGAERGGIERCCQTMATGLQSPSAFPPPRRPGGAATGRSSTCCAGGGTRGESAPLRTLATLAVASPPRWPGDAAGSTRLATMAAAWQSCPAFPAAAVARRRRARAARRSKKAARLRVRGPARPCGAAVRRSRAVVSECAEWYLHIRISISEIEVARTGPVPTRKGNS